MKGKLFSSIILSAITVLSAGADIVVTVPADCTAKSVAYYYAPIKQYASAKSRAERGMVTDSVKIENSKAVISIPNSADSYLFGLNIDDNSVRLYAKPGENINVKVTSTNPFDYSLSGTGLVEGINELKVLEAPVMAKVQALNSSGNANKEDMQALEKEYIGVQKEFINANPEGPAVAIALLNLEGEEFITIYESLPPAINNSILFPLVEKQYEYEKKSLEMEKKQQALQSGEVDAPNFTLKDLEGKDVSLSDFKGKWVILDFWGSWCPWCIKGFPELKEAYKKYSDKLEIIGVDCKEGEKEWRAGVAKYDLPWVNVYNPDNSPVLSEYGVQGFPTKAIIDPQGKIRNITVGHNPEFFTVLTELLGN